MATATPIAFLLCRFKGSNDEPMTKSAAEQMFTAAGRGTMNVVDWFDDNTHGNVDMTNNAVFGWFELSDTVDDYRSRRADGSYGRVKIIDLGRAAASDAGVDLSKFSAHVVVTNIEVDLFGWPGYAACTAVTANKAVWEMQCAPSVLCQEIIHALGAVEHSRRHGSDEDYADPYDVMSMFNAEWGVHPTNANIPVGPGLNAAFMERCGWLDQSRAAPLGSVSLRPLHRRELPGSLYALVGHYYVEYRVSQRWDRGFPSVVLVHYIANNTSYLVAELRSGMEYKWGGSFPYRSGGSVKVDAIDDATETATITTDYWPALPFPLAGPAISLTQGEWVDAGGLVIINGKLVRIPPRSPELRLIEAAARLVSIGELGLAPSVGSKARLDVYKALREHVAEAHHHLMEPQSPYDHMDANKLREFHEQRGAREQAGRKRSRK